MPLSNFQIFEVSRLSCIRDSDVLLSLRTSQDLLGDVSDSKQGVGDLLRCRGYSESAVPCSCYKMAKSRIRVVARCT